MIKTAIFKCVYWISNKDKIIFLFVGKSQEHKKLIDKLLESKTAKSPLTKTEEEKLRAFYENYDNTLKSTLLSNKDRKNGIEIIYENIYNDDNILTFKSKLVAYIGKKDKRLNINIDNIYSWFERHINKYSFLNILQSIYKTDKTIIKKISREELDKIFERVFNVKIDWDDIEDLKDKESYTINNLYENFQDVITTAFLPLEYNYYNKDGATRFNYTNPFEPMQLKEEFIKNDLEPRNIYNYKLNLFITLRTKIDINNCYLLNFTTSKNIYDTYRDVLTQKQATDAKIFNGAVYPYFPPITGVSRDFANYKDIKKELLDETRKIDTIIDDIYLCNNKCVQDQDKYVEKYTNFIEILQFKIDPILTEISVFKNLDFLFNSFTMNNNCPFLIYNKVLQNLPTRYNFERKYKINKPSLKFGRIAEDDLNKWTKLGDDARNENRKHKYKSQDHLIFKVLFTPNNKLEKNIYIEITLFNDGIIYIYCKFPQVYKIELPDLIKNLPAINEVITSINDILYSKLLELTEEMLYTYNDFIYLRFFKTHNSIIFNHQPKILQNQQELLKSISYLNPIFDINKDYTKDNKFLLFFKRINNYIYIDRLTGDIIKLVKKFGNIEDNRIIDTLVADGLYKRDAINEKIETLKKKEQLYVDFSLYNLIQAHNTTINITILNNFHINFEMKNMHDLYENSIIKDLMILLFNDESLLIKDDKATAKGKCCDKAINSYIGNLENKQDKINNIIEGEGEGEGEGDESEFDEDVEESDFDEDEIADLEDLENFDDFNDLDFDDSDEEEINVKSDTIVESEEQPITFDILKQQEKMGDINKYLLNRLKENDKYLFYFGQPAKKSYANSCQPTNRYPLVISKEEKERIDRDFPNSYRNYYKVGTTIEKFQNSYYICPYIWCQISRVTMNKAQLEANNGKCPSGEEPRILEGNIPSDASFNKGIKDDGSGRFISYIQRGLIHPDGFKIPCCSKTGSVIIGNMEYDFDSGNIVEIKTNKELTEEETKLAKSLEDKKEKSQAKGFKTLLTDPSKTNEVGRHNHLPEKLNNILGMEYNADDKSGRILKDKLYYVMTNLEPAGQPFITSMIYMLENPYMETIEDFKKLFEMHFSPIDFVLMNGGNTLKLFMKSGENVLNKDYTNLPEEELVEFVEWFISETDENVKEYIKKFRLEAIRDWLVKYGKIYSKNMSNRNKSENDDFKYIFDIKIEEKIKYIKNLNILREYMIYTAYKNYKKYILDDLFVKDHNDLLYIFQNNSHINPRNINIILLEYERDESNIDYLHILCPKYANYNIKFNNNTGFIILKKNTSTYHPLITTYLEVHYISKERKYKTKDVELITKHFQYDKSPNFKLIFDNLYKCSFYNPSNKKVGLITPLELTQINNVIDDLIFENYVINTSYKICGILFKYKNEMIYIPLNNTIYPIDFVEQSLDKAYAKFTYIFLNEVILYNKCSLSLAVIKNLFAKIYEIFPDPLYDFTQNSAQIIKKTPSAKTLLAIIIKSASQTNPQKHIIPLNIEESYEILFKEDIFEAFDNLFIFTNKVELNNQIMAILSYNNKQDEIKHRFNIIIKYLKSNKTAQEELEYIKHPYNPYPHSTKMLKVIELVKETAKKMKVIVNEEEMEIFAEKIINTSIDYLLTTNMRLDLKSHEIIFTQSQIENSYLKNLINLLQNPYKFIENSIEDYVNFNPIDLVSFNSRPKLPNFINIYNKLPIQPIEKWDILLPMLKVNVPVMEEYNTRDYLLDIFTNFLQITSGNSRKVREYLQKYIMNHYKKDFEMQKHKFLLAMRLNSSFVNKLYSLMDKDIRFFTADNIFDLIEFSHIAKIVSQPDYQYGRYELLKLGYEMQINIILIGEPHPLYLPNRDGIVCMNPNKSNRNKIIMFQVSWNDKSQEQYFLISKILTEKYVFFKTPEFFLNKDFIINYIDKYCQNYTLEELKKMQEEINKKQILTLES